MFLIAAVRVFRVVFVDRYLSAPEYTIATSTARSVNYILAQFSIEYLRAFACVYAFGRSFVRTYVRTYVRAYVRAYVRTNVRAFACSYVCPCSRLFARMFVRSFVRTYVRALARSYVVRAFLNTFLPGSVGLCSKTRVLCLQASPAKQGYYAQIMPD